MPQLIGQGGTLTLEAFFVDAGGDATDPGSPLISIIDANGDTVVSLDTPDHVGTGHYTYDYEVAVDAILGAWSAHWSGTINSAPVSTDEGFTVVLAGSIVTPTPGAAPGFLATVEELADVMRLPIGTIDEVAAAAALAGAGNLIRKEVGQHLDYVADDVIQLRSTGGRLMLLPELPVVDVTLVRIRVPSRDWVELTEGTDYELELGRDGMVWRIASALTFGGSLELMSPTLIGEWPRSLSGRGPNGWVEFTYSHGYALGDEFGSGIPAGVDVLPPIANTVALRVAARGYINPEAVSQETTGRATQVVYGDTPGLYLSKADKDDLGALRPGNRGGSR